MSTLNELRATKFKTIKSFASALNITPYQATNFLYQRDGGELYFKRQDEILSLLGITAEQYQEAAESTRVEEQAKWRAKHPPRPVAEVEAEFKASADAIYAKMTDADKRELHEFAVKHGYTGKSRSPLELMIARAWGLDY